jgi:hypothetical protein
LGTTGKFLSMIWKWQSKYFVLEFNDYLLSIAANVSR